jgi:S1-C subfamily serine protease
MDLFSKGVVITSIDANGYAAAQGFQPGDIVRAVNGNEIDRVGQLVRSINGANRWQIVIERGGRRAVLSFAG